LRQLPGVGAYTAGAIAAIAYDQPHPAIDSNVRRILCRLFAITSLSGMGDRQLEAYYRQIMPPRGNGDFLQALMDLGSLICTAKAPQCPQCPIASHCQARHQGIAAQIPHKPKRSPIPTRTAIALVYRTDTHALVQQAPADGLLPQLWTWPQIPADTPPASPWHFRGTFRHRYTHFRQILQVYELVHLAPARPSLPIPAPGIWQEIGNLPHLPMGTLARRITNSLFDRHPKM
jgi:A/G-specific adenine glycosylase